MDALDRADDRGPSSNVLLSLKAALVQGEELLASLPIGVYTCDRDGVLVQYNHKAAELWGRSPPTGEIQTESAMIEVLRTGRPVRDREFVAERPDGSRVTILANTDPLFDDDGELIGAVSCFQDISALRRASVRLHDQERSFRGLLDALPVAIYTTDAKGKITFFNKSAADLAGREPKLGEDDWCVTWRLYHPDGTPLPHDQCPMAQALKRDESIRGAEAIVERPDGTRIPMTPYPTPLHDADGNLVGAVNMLIDISERKKAEAQQKALIDEVNHRVKNTLATVQALAGQTLRGAASKDMRDAFEARLLALSRVHDQLARRQWECAELETILKDVFAPYRGERGDHIRLGGSSVSLPPKVALTLAMVLHELATNAAHFGALSSQNGTLTVTWRLNETGAQPMLHLDWSEDGGPAAVAPAAQGFGLKLLQRGVEKELGGESRIAFAPEGVRCALDIPVLTRR
ncbi:MAG TPA: HWE histidine kinase domain-containing protein [Rhizomicrobium sp.]|nr:HWE histidine kinase domain-containing protein [Rhizomicrobium sp.]